jgi:hypothetical protein
LGNYELLLYKPYFDKKCSSLSDERNGLQSLSQMYGDNLNNVSYESSGHFRNKKMEYLKNKINEFEINSKSKNIKRFIEA